MAVHPSLLRTASPNQRMGAWVLDLMLINVPVLVLMNAGVSAGLPPWLVVMAAVGGTTVLMGALDGSPRGASFGKRFAGTRVVDAENGEPIGFARGVLRRVVFFFGGFPLYAGWWWIFTNERCRAWHDLAARSMVVRAQN